MDQIKDTAHILDTSVLTTDPEAGHMVSTRRSRLPPSDHLIFMTPSGFHEIIDSR